MDRNNTAQRSEVFQYYTTVLMHIHLGHTLKKTNEIISRQHEDTFDYYNLICAASPRWRLVIKPAFLFTTAMIKVLVIFSKMRRRSYDVGNRCQIAVALSSCISRIPLQSHSILYCFPFALMWQSTNQYVRRSMSSKIFSTERESTLTPYSMSFNPPFTTSLLMLLPSSLWNGGH